MQNPLVSNPNSSTTGAAARPFVHEIKTMLVEELDLPGRSADDIDETAPLFGEGLGLDSLDALQIAMAIEDRFGVRVPEGKAARPIFANVLALAAFVAENAAAAE